MIGVVSDRALGLVLHQPLHGRARCVLCEHRPYRNGLPAGLLAEAPAHCRNIYARASVQTVSARASLHPLGHMPRKPSEHPPDGPAVPDKRLNCALHRLGDHKSCKRCRPRTEPTLDRMDRNPELFAISLAAAVSALQFEHPGAISRQNPVLALACVLGRACSYYLVEQPGLWLRDKLNKAWATSGEHGTQDELEVEGYIVNCSCGRNFVWIYFLAERPELEGKSGANLAGCSGVPAVGRL